MLQEEDERFFVGVYRTRSDAYVVADLREHGHVGGLRCSTADGPDAEPRLRGRGGTASSTTVDHDGQRLVVLTNDDAPNFRLVDEEGRELVAHREDVRLDEIEPFAGHLVLAERADALLRLRVDGESSSSPSRSTPPGPATTWSSTRTVPLRVHVARHARQHGRPRLSSAGAPFASASRCATTIPDDYATERLWATAADGERIPISLVYRRDRPDGPGPLLLYGYGSYEASMDPTFSPLRLSLLDRGFAYAIAHVRGGGERGCRWYENGKFQHKPNTFTDFIACAEHLVAEDWTAPDRLVAAAAAPEACSWARS